MRKMVKLINIRMKDTLSNATAWVLNSRKTKPSQIYIEVISKWLHGYSILITIIVVECLDKYFNKLKTHSILMSLEHFWG